MKRRHYRIRYTDHAQPMRRVKHVEVRWDVIFLVLLAAAIVAVGGFAVYRWISINGVV